MFRAGKEGGFQVKRIISKVHGPRQAWWASSQAVDWGLGLGTRAVPTLCARNGSVSWGRAFIEATSNHSSSWGHWKHSCTSHPLPVQESLQERLGSRCGFDFPVISLGARDRVESNRGGTMDCHVLSSCYQF